MARSYTKLAFNQSVKAVQQQYGTRRQAQRMESLDWADDRLGPREAEFIAGRDSFYMATVGENGWPYVQFRGGPKGFLKVLDEKRLAYADFRGNLQYISTGNLKQDDRVALILMDYAHQRRLKIMARAEIVEASQRPDLVEELHDASYKARPERAVIFHLEAFDWNCPQHITPRFTLEEFAQARTA